LVRCYRWGEDAEQHFVDWEFREFCDILISRFRNIARRVVKGMRNGFGLVSVLSVVAAASTVGAYELVGIEWDTGDLYGISTADASLTLIGKTKVTGGADLALAPDGYLYTFSTGDFCVPYRIDPFSATTMSKDPFFVEGNKVFEGALAFDEGGNGWAANIGDADEPHGMLMHFGEMGYLGGGMTIKDQIGEFPHDINGWVDFDDTSLIGIDRETNAIVKVFKSNLDIVQIKALDFKVGEIGGLTALNGKYYIATGNETVIYGGTNSLYELDPSTWDTKLIGKFSITTLGFSGIAPVPEPATMTGLAVACLYLVRRARRSR